MNNHRKHAITAGFVQQLAWDGYFQRPQNVQLPVSSFLVVAEKKIWLVYLSEYKVYKSH